MQGLIVKLEFKGRSTAFLRQFNKIFLTKKIFSFLSYDKNVCYAKFQGIKKPCSFPLAAYKVSLIRKLSTYLRVSGKKFDPQQRKELPAPRTINEVVLLLRVDRGELHALHIAQVLRLVPVVLAGAADPITRPAKQVLARATDEPLLTPVTGRLTQHDGRKHARLWKNTR